MIYYKHFIGDYQRDTMRLSMIEDAAYRRLLDEYYASETPLPADVDECCRAARAFTEEEKAAVAKVLDRFFAIEGGVYRNKRADKEIATRMARAAAGRKGADGKWHGKHDGKEVANEPENDGKRDASHSHSQTPQPQPLKDSPAHARADPDPLAIPPFLDRRSDDLKQAMAVWNDMAVQHGLPQAQRLSNQRGRKLRKRLAECGGLDGWREACGKVAASAFLRGETTDWRADFDFLLQQSKFSKLMEGGYDNGRGNSGGGLRPVDNSAAVEEAIRRTEERGRTIDG